MTFSRKIIRAILFFTFLIAFTVIVFVIALTSLKSEGGWAAIAGALAVIATVISVWISQKSLEIQQDAQLPNPYPSVDLYSRYGLIQLSINNYGQSPAHNIKLYWDKPLINSDGEQITFNNGENAPDIAVLLPNESTSVLIDGEMQFFQSIEDANYSGLIEYQDSRGVIHKNKFYLNIEKHRLSLAYENEELKTHYMLQQIPDKLDKCTNNIKNYLIEVSKNNDTYKKYIHMMKKKKRNKSLYS